MAEAYPGEAEEPQYESVTVPLRVFSCDDFDIDTNHLGQGAMGTVYRAYHGKERRDYAVKTSSSSMSADSEAARQLVTEVTIMAQTRNPYILSVHGMAKNEDDLVGIVMDYMKHGSVYDIVKKKIAIPMPLKLRIIYETAQAMNVLHANHVLHLDIKSPNILLDDDFHVKLTDFGLAAKFVNTMSTIGTRNVLDTDQVAGTLCFIAPEVFADINTKRSKRLDLYAFGITMWQILTGKWPYENAINDTLIMTAVKEGQRPDLTDIPPAVGGLEKAVNKVVLLMQRCWHQDPNQRPFFSEILEILAPINEEVEIEAKANALDLERQFRARNSQILPEGATGDTDMDTSGLTQRFDGLNMRDALGKESAFARSIARFPIPENMVEADTNLKEVGECNVAINKASLPALNLTEDLTRVGMTPERPNMMQPGEQVNLPSGVFSAAPHSIDTTVPNELAEVSDELIQAIAPRLVNEWNEFATHLRLTEQELSFVSQASDTADANAEVVMLGLSLWKRKFGEKAIRKWLLAACVHMKLYTLIGLFR